MAAPAAEKPPRRLRHHPHRGRARARRGAQAVAFDAETGRPDVAPDLPAAGTQLRWSAPKLIAAANKKVPGANVRALHALATAPVKAGPTTAAAEPAPEPTAPAAPIQRACSEGSDRVPHACAERGFVPCRSLTRNGGYVAGYVETSSLERQRAHPLSDF